MSHGRCTICGIELSMNWHADHVTPYSKGGETELYNGQALCPECNLKKGAKPGIKLRDWQKAFYENIKDRMGRGVKSYMLHAGVGSGKTIAATYFASDLIRQGWNVIICSPSDNVRNSWAKEFHQFSADIDNSYTFKYNYKTDYHGISTTYHALSFDNNVEFLINNRVVDDRTLLILDEVHHLGDKQSWGKNIKLIGDKCGFVLLLTGTPTRSDNNMIPFAEYEPTTENNRYKLKVNYGYGYDKAVRDKICCPISFRAVDIISETKNVYGYLSYDDEAKGDILRNMLTVSSNSFVYDMYKKADKALNELRQRKKDAAGLIVCNSQKDAKDLGEMIPDSVVVISDENDSSDIDKFADSDKKWIISVKMVSEGVNIPRIRVIVYAINCTTMLFTQQVAGRGVRNRNDASMGSIDHCILYYYRYEPLVENARTIEAEIKHIVQMQEDDIKNEDWTEKKDREYCDEDECDLQEYIEVYAGDVSYINAGIDIPDDIKKHKDKIEEVVFNDLTRVFAEQQRKINEYEGRSIIKSSGGTLMKKEQVKQLKKHITREVNSVAFKKNNYSKVNIDNVISKIHYDLNTRSGIKDQSNENNLDRLNKKLELAINYNHE